MESKNEQDNYLQSLISTTEVKQRRRRKPGEESNKPDRGNCFIYEVSTPKGKHQVCLKAFANIHAITPGRIRRLNELLVSGKSPKDMRGKATSGNVTPANVVNAIKSHIACFPVKIARYSSREFHYLNERLNVLEMYNLFKQLHPNLDVKYKFYLKIFKENFTLHFGRPQVDTCCTCEALEVKIKSKFLNDTAKQVHVAEKMVHVRRAKKFYKKMKEITTTVANVENIGAISIDFMQNLQLPTVPVQETFYLRQLTVNVFCIHNLKDNTSVFYLYHEGQAGKGPNEVCSFILDYIKSSLKNVEHLHIFSDGCFGQNKNHCLLRLMNAFVSSKKFQSVQQYFPVRGHSFLPCDRDFAMVKKKLRKCDRVFTLKQYAELILSSSAKQKFLVVLVESDDVIDVSRWWPKFFKKMVLSEETRGKEIPKEQKVRLRISKFMHFSHHASAPFVIKARTYIDGLQVQTFNVRNPTPDPLTMPIDVAYPKGFIPINSKKMDDLKKFQEYIPQEEEIKSFYDTVYSWETINREENEEVDMEN